MVPTDESTVKPYELDLPKDRATINIDRLDHEIVLNLIGVIGNSKSAVICQMVKDWIKQNTDKLINTWEIDLPGIKRQIIAEAKGIKIDKDLKDFEESVIEQIPELFEAIESISIEEAAKMLEIAPFTLRKIIIYHRKTLEEKGLELTYKDGSIINKKFE
ncbi:MAG: hypothetical protein ACFE94_14010 [Candidatus Hodarchaeota archaeon]